MKAPSFLELGKKLEKKFSNGHSMILLGSPEHHDYVERTSTKFSKNRVNFVQQNHYDQAGIYPLSAFLAFGPEPKPSPIQGYKNLFRKGVTHVLRVRQEGISMPWFRRSLPQILHVPIPTDASLWEKDIEHIISSLHRLLHSDLEPRVFVHCWKGLDRSATTLWLYLQALGFSSEIADQALLYARASASPGKAPLIKKHEGFDEDLRNIGKQLHSVRSDLFEVLYPMEWPK